MSPLLRLERKQKKFFKPISNSHISLSFLLIWNWNDKYVHILPYFPRKIILDSRPKWEKCIPVFRPKQRKNPTLWGGTYLYSLYKEVPPTRGKTVSSFILYPYGSRVEQWWEYSPPTNVARVQISPASKPFVGCWSSSLLWQVFLLFSSPQKPTSTNSNSTRNQVDGEPLGGCATSKSFLFIFCF